MLLITIQYYIPFKSLCFDWCRGVAHGGSQKVINSLKKKILTFMQVMQGVNITVQQS